MCGDGQAGSAPRIRETPFRTSSTVEQAAVNDGIAAAIAMRLNSSWVLDMAIDPPIER